MVFKNGDCVADDSLRKIRFSNAEVFQSCPVFSGVFCKFFIDLVLLFSFGFCSCRTCSVSIEKRINRDTECGQDGMDKRDRRLASDWDNGNASGFKRTKRHFVAYTVEHR